MSRRRINRGPTTLPPPIVVHQKIAPPLMPQQGGFPLAGLITAAPAIYKGYTTFKPATKAKKALDGSNFKKKHPTLAGIADKILDVGIKLGGNEQTMAVIVKKPARKPRKKQAGGAKKKKGGKKK